MSQIDPRSEDQYTITFTSNRLLLAICSFLLLLVLCMMLGIRIERYQQQQNAYLEARAGLNADEATPSIVRAPTVADAPTDRTLVPRTPATATNARTITANDLSDEVPPPVKTLRVKSTASRRTLAARPTASTPTPKRTTSAPAAGKYVVQVTSSRDKALAKQRANLLAKQGVPAFVEAANLGSKGTWYRVLAGTYSSKTAAKASLAKLQSDPQFEASFVRTY